MALFSKVQEMAARLVNEVRLIIKPTAPKAREPQARQPVGKMAKGDKAVVKPNAKTQSTVKAGVVQTVPTDKATVESVGAETNQSSKTKEVVQPLTYSGPVKIPEPLPLELLTDDELKMTGAKPNGNTAGALTAEPVTTATGNTSQAEDTVKVKKIEAVVPKLETPEPKAGSTAPEARSETPIKPPEPKPEAGKKPPAPEGEKAMFANLFGKAVEEEETPLDRLMKSLPDITIEEVQSEAAEVQGLMNDWLQSKAQR